MTNQTEPKTRTPIFRMAAGISAAAAVLTLTGGLGYMLLSVKQDVEQSSAASQLAAQSSAYAAYFAEYYEARAGHPVDFDFTTLCGTDFDETWDFESSTVHLVAAVSDGYSLDYLYTVTPKSDWSYSQEAWMQLPVIEVFAPEGPYSLTRENSPHNYLVGTELREDGSLLCFGSVCIMEGALPLSGNVPHYRVSCIEHQTDDYDRNDMDARDFTVNIPTEAPECRPLTGGTLTAAFAVGAEAEEYTFTHSIVTPLGLILTNYDQNDLAENDLAEAYNHPVGVGGVGGNVPQDAVTVMKALHRVENPQPVDITYAHMFDNITGDYDALQFDAEQKRYLPENIGRCARCWKKQFDDNGAEYITAWLPFTEPQALDEVLFLQLYSAAEPDNMICAIVNMDQYSEPVEVQTDDGTEIIDEDLIQAESMEYPPLDILNAQWRTKEFDFGFVTVDGISYTENREPAINLTVIPNETAIAESGQELEIRFTPIGYDGLGNRYEIYNEQVMQGAKWVASTEPDADGAYHMQLVLDPITLRVEENGETALLTDDDGNMYWEYLNIELYLNMMQMRKEPFDITGDIYGISTEDMVAYSWENWDYYHIEPWKFTFGTAAYQNFHDLTEAQRTRELEFGTVRTDDITREDGVPVLHYSVKLHENAALPEDAYAICQLLPIGFAGEDVIIFNIDSETGAQIVAEEPDAEGWYHFSEPLIPQEGELPESFAVDVRLSLMIVGSESDTANRIDYDINAPTEEGGMYHICRFTTD